MFKFQVKIPQLKRLNLKPRQIDEALNILVDDVKKNTPVDSGKLKASISKRKSSTGGSFYLRGKRNNEVAGYLIKGTKSHFIRPKKKDGVLAWIGSNGKLFFSKGHRVRGIKKGYWTFRPSRTALNKFARRIALFIKANANS